MSLKILHKLMAFSFTIISKFASINPFYQLNLSALKKIQHETIFLNVTGKCENVILKF